jgi:integrase
MIIDDKNKEMFFDFKSSATYDKWINNFQQWVSLNDKDFSASSVLYYLSELSERYAPTSLWTIYSILNKFMKVFYSIDLNQCFLLKDFLKNLDKTHCPKKSSVLSSNDIENFVNKTDESVLIKCILLIGVYGLLRISELTDLLFDDVTKKGSCYSFLIRKSKTDQKSKGFYFIVDRDIHWIEKYINMFSLQDRKGRFFRKIIGDRGTKTPLGKNWIGKVPFKIASALSLNDPHLFTGHCFRRSGATILVDNGADKLILKRAGRWKSDTVCEGYVEESVDSKIKISKIISGEERNTSLESSEKKGNGSAQITNIVISGGQGFTFNFK